MQTCTSFCKTSFLKNGKVLKNMDRLGKKRPFAKVQNPGAPPLPAAVVCLVCMCACAWQPFVRPFLTCARTKELPPPCAGSSDGWLGWSLSRTGKTDYYYIFLPSNGHHDQKRGATELLLLLNARFSVLLRLNSSNDLDSEFCQGPDR